MIRGRLIITGTQPTGQRVATGLILRRTVQQTLSELDEGPQQSRMTRAATTDRRHSPDRCRADRAVQPRRVCCRELPAWHARRGASLISFRDVAHGNTHRKALKTGRCIRVRLGFPVTTSHRRAARQRRPPLEALDRCLLLAAPCGPDKSPAGVLIGTIRIEEQPCEPFLDVEPPSSS